MAMHTKKAAARRGGEAAPADVVDEQLSRYRSMRDFSVTTEPAGGERSGAKGAGLPFVIQKHAASHLHYDFRLGWNGVLKSWACAKGPSYNPKDRRLAIQVEDHPMEYGGFEGIIPKGQYGGGTVMVWDQGAWAPQPGHEDVDAGLRDGSLKFTMNGEKMQGKWTLVRMGGKAAHETKLAWLLIKEHDDFERGTDDPAITEEKPDSAVTGRSLEQIAAAEDHVWNSKETAKPGQAWERREPLDAASEERSGKKAAVKKTKGSSSAKSATAKRSKKVSGVDETLLAGCPREKQPEFVPPQLAIEGTAPPEGVDWLHELKLDGYRVQARKSGKEMKLLTRKGLDWTQRMQAVAKAVGGMAVEDATMDGEVVVLGADGNSNFAELQASFQEGATHLLTYFVFDLMHLNGRNTRGLPLRERKELLSALLPKDDEVLRFSEHIEGTGASVFRHACELHAEGIISKRSDAPYRSTRGGDWLKSKCLREQEFVVGGYTLSTEGDDRIGSLLLGYYEGRKLVYAGRTGTGFTQKMKRDLLTQLTKIKEAKPAFDRVPNEAKRGALWVKPQLVAQVRFATWTADDLVRQAAFLGLREDKPAREVVREEASVAPKPKHAAVKPKDAAAKHASHPAGSSAKAAKVAKKDAEAEVELPAILKKIRLTHPDKVLDPESGLTKQQLAVYYAEVAVHMLPQIADRPMSLVRCPEGAGKPCFFQKHVNAMLPKGIGSVEITDKKSGKPEPYITLHTAEALVGLAQMGVLEIHPWGSRNEDLEHPDRLIFDLDPDESLPWSKLTEAAGEVRKRLKKAGLESFLKLTGGKGLHIVVPIEPELGWSEVKELAHRFVLTMERDAPGLYLTKMTKAARVGKIYLDYLRNERGSTAVAPYSPRARMGAHVSLPLPWSALKETERPVYSVHDFSAWRSKLRSDPWKAMLSTRQRLLPDKFDRL